MLTAIVPAMIRRRYMMMKRPTASARMSPIRYFSWSVSFGFMASSTTRPVAHGMAMVKIWPAIASRIEIPSTSRWSRIRPKPRRSVGQKDLRTSAPEVSSSGSGGMVEARGRLIRRTSR